MPQTRSPETDPASAPCHVVFLHGAGLAPWIWDATRRHLSVPSTALDVPSNRPGTDPLLCAAEILANPSFPAQGPVILVLHSLAGVLETSMAMGLCTRLRHVVHVASVVPAPGRSFVQTRGFPINLILPLLFRLHPKGLAPSPAMLLRQLGHDLGDALRAELVARHRPVLPELHLKPVPCEEVQVPRTYIICTDDRCVTPRQQTRIATRLGAQVRSLECGHLPMLSRPADVAGIVERAASSATVREFAVDTE